MHVFTPDGSITNHSRSTARDLFEIGVAYILLEAALWTTGHTQQLWGLATLAWVVVGTVLSRRRPRELGIAAAGFRASAWIVLAAVVVAALMLFAAALAGTLHILTGAHAPLSHIALYIVWSVVQEFLLQSFIFVRFESAFHSGGKAVAASSILFSVAHLPNPVLVPVTLLMALVFTSLFRRYRNIYALGIAHAILGLALSVSLPYAMTHNMRVGIAYWL